jgi:hypothetical protein
MNRLPGAVLTLAFFIGCVNAQVIEFEANGLKYQALTRSGITIMYARLAPRIHKYAIVQLAITNASTGPYTVRPEDCTYVRDGGDVPASSAKEVIQLLMKSGSSSDATKLITAYESWVAGIPNYRATNGFESRRQSALGMGASKVRSAAAASALALVQTKIAPGDTTDGAVFFATDGKPLAGGKLVIKTNTDRFEFKAD